jgi:hypothetical protein
LASSILPHNLFEEAQLYYIDLVQYHASLLTKDTNSGQVASTLDLLSQGKVRKQIDKYHENLLRVPSPSCFLSS